MKYICPICGREFEKDTNVSQHFLKCWKRENPHHKSKPAPRSKDIDVKEMSDDIKEFFNSFGAG